MSDDKNSVDVRISAKADGFKSAMLDTVRSIQQSVHQMGEDIKRLASTMDDTFKKMANSAQQAQLSVKSTDLALAQAANNARSAGNIYIQVNQQINQSFIDLSRTINDSSRTVNNFGQAAASASNAARAAGNAAGSASHGFSLTAGTARELAVIFRELSVGDTTRLTGSFIVLANRMGFAQGIIAALISPLGLASIAMGILAYSMSKGAEEQRNFQRDLILTGNIAGMTEDRFNKLAETLSNKTNNTIGKTRETLSTLVASGQYTRKSIELMGEAALVFGKKSGMGVDEALEKFMTVERGVARAAAELNKHYAFLSVEEAKRIKRLEEMGKKDEATQILMQAVIKKTDTLTQNLGYLANAWKKVSEWTSKAFEAMMEWGKAATKGEQLEDLKQQEQQLQKNIAQQRQFGNTAVAQDGYKALLTVQEKIKKITGEIAADDKKADQQAASRAKEQKQVADILTPPKNKKTGATSYQVEKDELLKYLNEQEAAAQREGKIYTDRSSDEAAFWETKLKHLKQGSKEYIQTDIRFQEASLRLKRETTQAQLDNLRYQQEVAGSDYDKRLQIEDKIINMYRKGSDAYEKEMRHRVSIQREQDRQKDELEKLRIKQGETFLLQDIDDQEEAAKMQLDRGSINMKKYLDQMISFETEKRAIHLASIDAESDGNKKGGSFDPKKEAQLELEKQKVIRDSNKTIIKINRDAAKDAQKPWDDAFKHLASAFEQHFAKMIKGQETFSQVVRYTLGDMVLYGVKMAEEAATKWIATKVKEMLFGETVEQAKATSAELGAAQQMAAQAGASATTIGTKSTEGMAVIGTNAGEAASGAASSVASIPYIGPILAASAFAAVLAMVLGAKSNVKSSRGGYSIPRGVNPLIQAHEEETVLPKEESNVIRGLARMFGAGGMQFMGAGGGTVNNFHMSFPNSDADSFKRTLTQVQRDTKKKLGGSR